MKHRIKQIIKMAMQHIVLPFVYFINKFHKINQKKIVFADAHHTECPPHMELLRKRMQDAGYEVCDYFFDLSALGTFAGFRKLCGFMKIYAGAGTVIVCDYFLPANSCKKRKNTLLIQLWHAAGAFKKFGYDANDDIPEHYKGNVHKNYDLVTVSGKNCVGPFESAMRINNDKKIVKPFGISITDRLYNKEFKKDCFDKFYLNYPEACGKKIILWAPTFRGNAAEARVCGEEAIDYVSKHSDEFFVIKSLHPHMKKNKEQPVMTTEELMVVADILITDYSSVFFDYLILDKPIVFFAPDYFDYYENRGFYLEYDKLPGIIIKENENLLLLNAIKNCITRDEYSIIRNEFRANNLDGCDGNATERILNYVKGYQII